MSIKARFLSARSKASSALIDHIIQNGTLEDRNALFRTMRAESLKASGSVDFPPMPDSFWKLLIRGFVLDEQPNDLPRVSAIMLKMSSQFHELISMELGKQPHKKGKGG